MKNKINTDLIKKINKLIKVQDRLGRQEGKSMLTVNVWSNLVENINKDLRKIKRGTARWVIPCEYKGTGQVRIPELNNFSCEVVSFHESSLEKDYKEGIVVEFDFLELETWHKYPKLTVNGLK